MQGRAGAELRCDRSLRRVLPDAPFRELIAAPVPSSTMKEDPR
jgi:hypothetical protein